MKITDVGLVAKFPMILIKLVIMKQLFVLLVVNIFDKNTFTMLASEYFIEQVLLHDISNYKTFKTLFFVLIGIHSM